MTVKRKISVSLDEDVLQELERSDEPVSVQVNDALRRALQARRRSRLLGDLLEELETARGGVDEVLVEKYTQLLR